MTRRLVVAAVWVGALATAGTASAEIHWETKLDRAGAAAQQANQPMLLEFWATWCEPCKEMDRDVYADERVVSAIGKVRPVRIDIDREPGLMRKYSVSGTPTLLLTDSYGRELFRYQGTLPLERMIQLLEALPADVTTINRHSAALTAKKDDFAALSGMARELRAAGFYRTGNEYCERALRTREGRHAGDARVELLIARERNALELRHYADAARFCQDALDEIAGRPEETEVRRDLARALEGVGRPRG
jgi:thioredoxin-like negative regulator of GroEL